MKKSILMMAAVAILVLFLAGCTGSKSSATNPYVGGTSGLVVSFVENAPPAMVTDSQFPFQVGVRLENAGEKDVAAGAAKVTITGMNPADFGNGVTSGQNGNTILGAKRDFSGNSIAGTEDQVIFPSDTTSFVARTIVGSLEIPLGVSVCYPYQTSASGTYCMKKNIMSNVPGVCNPIGAQTLYCSGAPVQVTSLTESTAGQNSIMLSFTIAHKSNGYVFRRYPSPNPDCDESKVSDQNKVTVTITVPGAGGMQCYGLSTIAASSGGSATTQIGEVTLGTNGQTTVSCRLTNLPAIDAVGEASVTLDYNYLDKKSAGTLQVRHVATG